MKKILLAASILMGVLFFGKSQAQINISINIGSQPAWGPTGYNHVDYYYLPDINSYYNVNTAQYIYLQGNKWRYTKKLPKRYRNYNIYNSYKVVVNRQNPYQNNRMDVQNYGKYKGQHSQPMLRDNRQTVVRNTNRTVVQKKNVTVKRGNQNDRGDDRRNQNGRR